MTPIDEEFQTDALIIQEGIWDTIFPQLMEVEEQFPEQSAFFIMFIETMYVLFEQGWTVDELQKELQDHKKLFDEDQESGTLH